MMWLVVTERLVELLPTLPGWSDVKVYDGPPVTEDRPLQYVIVGSTEDADEAGGYTQETTRLSGSFLTETGSVVSHLVCQSGTVNLPTVRAQAFALAAALEVYVRDEPRLEVLPSAAVTSLAVDVRPIQGGGSAQTLVLTLSYTAPVT